MMATCLGGLVFWASTTHLDSAVLATGIVEVASRSQRIQPTEAGTVQSIIVRNGDAVQAHQPVLILDSADLLEQRRIVSRQLFESMLSMDRLLSETNHHDRLQPRSAVLEEAAQDPDLERRLEEETARFAAWQALQLAREEQSAGRHASFEATITALSRQLDALFEARAFLLERIAERQTLVSRGLERASVVQQLERERMELDAQIAGLDARLAETRGALRATIDENREVIETERERALAEFRDQAATEGELRSQLRLIESRLERQILRAPVQGIVHDLQVFTEGGVVAPGQVLMTIIPDNEPMILLVRISPTDIEHVSMGQGTLVQFPGLSSRDLAPVSARVRTVAPNVTVDESTGEQYYAVELSMDNTPQGVLDGIALVPGMPVQASILTGTRSVMEYLIGPMTDFFRPALREN